MNQLVIIGLINIKKFRAFFVEARNNVGFHYQTHKRLIDGYRKFLLKGISNVVPEARKFAYWSIAREFSDSRYYYADASLQGYYINLFGDEKMAQERVEEIFGLLNLVVYSVMTFLKNITPIFLTAEKVTKEVGV